jgi:hypothetical protein
MPYTATSYQYPPAAPVPGGTFESSWSSSLDPTTPNDPTVSALLEILGWSGSGVVSQPQINEGHPAVNANYQGLLIPARGNPWGETHYNNDDFTFKSTPFPDTATPSKTSNNMAYFSSAPMPVSSYHSAPASHQPAASTRPPSPDTRIVVVPQYTAKKRKTTAAGPKKQPQLKPRNSKPSTPAAIKAGTSTSEQLSRGGQALQSCQADLDDIAHNRLKVLESNRCALELDTQKLVAEVNALKETADRNQRQLEAAFKLAERIEEGADEQREGARE